MENKPRPKMSIENRAKQFMPFSALRGLEQALALKEKIIVDKIELSEEMAEELDRQMHLVKKGTMVTVVYFHKDEYIKTTGMVARIEPSLRLLQIVITRINFDDIIQLVIHNNISD